MSKTSLLSDEDGGLGDSMYTSTNFRGGRNDDEFVEEKNGNYLDVTSLKPQTVTDQSNRVAALDILCGFKGKKADPYVNQINSIESKEDDKTIFISNNEQNSMESSVVYTCSGAIAHEQCIEASNKYRKGNSLSPISIKPLHDAIRDFPSGMSADDPIHTVQPKTGAILSTSRPKLLDSSNQTNLLKDIKQRLQSYHWIHSTRWIGFVVACNIVLLLLAFVEFPLNKQGKHGGDLVCVSSIIEFVCLGFVFFDIWFMFILDSYTEVKRVYHPYRISYTNNRKTNKQVLQHDDLAIPPVNIHTNIAQLYTQFSHQFQDPNQRYNIKYATTYGSQVLLHPHFDISKSNLVNMYGEPIAALQTFLRHTPEFPDGYGDLPALPPQTQDALPVVPFDYTETRYVVIHAPIWQIIRLIGVIVCTLDALQFFLVYYHHYGMVEKVIPTAVASSIVAIRLFRWVRPLLMLSRIRNQRTVCTGYMYAFFHSLQLLLIAGVMVAFFAFLGYFYFNTAGDHPNYENITTHNYWFQSIQSAIYFTLHTFLSPGRIIVMIAPYYDGSFWICFYVAAFLFLFSIFLLNALIALGFGAYKRRMQRQYQSRSLRRSEAFHVAFETIKRHIKISLLHQADVNTTNITTTFETDGVMLHTWIHQCRAIANKGYTIPLQTGISECHNETLFRDPKFCQNPQLYKEILLDAVQTVEYSVYKAPVKPRMCSGGVGLLQKEFSKKQLAEIDTVALALFDLLKQRKDVRDTGDDGVVVEYLDLQGFSDACLLLDLSRADERRKTEPLPLHEDSPNTSVQSLVVDRPHRAISISNEDPQQSISHLSAGVIQNGSDPRPLVRTSFHLTENSDGTQEEENEHEAERHWFFVYRAKTKAIVYKFYTYRFNFSCRKYTRDKRQNILLSELVISAVIVLSFFQMIHFVRTKAREGDNFSYQSYLATGWGFIVILCLLLFMLEFSTKQWVFGLKRFLRKKQNILDVLLSIGMVLCLTILPQSTSISALLLSLRATRLFRIMMLIPKLNDMLTTMSHVLPSLSNLMIVFTLIVYGVASIFQDQFGGRLDAKHNILLQREDCEEWRKYQYMLHFDDMHTSVMNLLIITVTNVFFQFEMPLRAARSSVNSSGIAKWDYTGPILLVVSRALFLLVILPVFVGFTMETFNKNLSKIKEYVSTTRSSRKLRSRDYFDNLNTRRMELPQTDAASVESTTGTTKLAAKAILPNLHVYTMNGELRAQSIVVPKNLYREPLEVHVLSKRADAVSMGVLGVEDNEQVVLRKYVDDTNEEEE